MSLSAAASALAVARQHSVKVLPHRSKDGRASHRYALEHDGEVEHISESQLRQMRKITTRQFTPDVLKRKSILRGRPRSIYEVQCLVRGRHVNCFEYLYGLYMILFGCYNISMISYQFFTLWSPTQFDCPEKDGVELDPGATCDTPRATRFERMASEPNMETLAVFVIPFVECFFVSYVFLRVLFFGVIYIFDIRKKDKRLGTLRGKTEDQKRLERAKTIHDDTYNKGFWLQTVTQAIIWSSSYSAMKLIRYIRIGRLSRDIRRDVTQIESSIIHQAQQPKEHRACWATCCLEYGCVIRESDMLDEEGHDVSYGLQTCIAVCAGILRFCLGVLGIVAFFYKIIPILPQFLNLMNVIFTEEGYEIVSIRLVKDPLNFMYLVLFINQLLGVTQATDLMNESVEFFVSAGGGRAAKYNTASQRHRNIVMFYMFDAAEDRKGYLRAILWLLNWNHAYITGLLLGESPDQVRLKRNKEIAGIKDEYEVSEDRLYDDHGAVDARELEQHEQVYEQDGGAAASAPVSNGVP